jgi:hypothetical protein
MRRSSRGTLCFTCMVLLAVGLLFTAMVVYIKFTHLLGYRAPASAPAATFSHQPTAGGSWLGGGGGGGGVGEWGEGSSGGDAARGGPGLGGVPEQVYGEPDPWQGHGGEL